MNLLNNSITKPFPPIFNQTTLSYLKGCNGFGDARRGDMRAAQLVIAQCVKSRKIIEIKRKFPDAILLPLIQKNKLPQAFAQSIGLKTDSRIYISLRTKHIMASIIKGEKYILVDDIFCDNELTFLLYNYVIKHGGRVSAVATLACIDRDLQAYNKMQNNISLAG